MPAKLTHTDTTFQITIESVGKGRVSGRAAGPLFPEPLHFSDLGQLVLSLEDVFDRHNFPQAFQRARRFAPKQDQTPEPRHAAAALSDVPEPLKPFTLTVLTRRSSTWQGFVIWEDDSRVPFISTLALLKLIGRHYNL